jgi:hypothetical protein
MLKKFTSNICYFQFYVNQISNATARILEIYEAKTIKNV